MVNIKGFLAGLSLAVSSTPSLAVLQQLDLQGFVDAQGALSVQYHGDTVDPYFSLQALLLAHDNGMDISAYALPWVNWLAPRQKLDATFDRYCLNGPVWAPCKAADADDALLALWMRLLDTMPRQRDSNPVLRKSYAASQVALHRLLDPHRGVYLVSPVYQHGLFMDNLEVLSWHLPALSRKVGRGQPSAQQLSANMRRVFWDGASKSFLVSTQPEQRTVKPAFYPEYVAQILPLLFDFKTPGLEPNRLYNNWMRTHRAIWLAQSQHDFAWGLIAIIALRSNDRATAACWLRETAAAWNTLHWTVTDEVARQILLKNNVNTAAPDAVCT